MCTVFPDGKMIFTCNEMIRDEMFVMIQGLFRTWVNEDGNHPLVIGNCTVQFASAATEAISVERP